MSWCTPVYPEKTKAPVAAEAFERDHEMQAVESVPIAQKTGNSSHFQTHGRALLGNGYLIVPIKPGHKRPALENWQSARLGATDLGRYGSGHGVGVLCGQGANPVVGVDIDVSHPVIGPALIEWCRRHLGWAPERVGAAPRILLVYRAADAGWGKGSSVAFFDPTDPTKPNGKRNEQRIEVLGRGQQFVAYHVHPDTGRPYEWVDLFGGLDSMAARDLPVVSEEQIAALMEEVARVVRTTPGVEEISTGSALRVQATDDPLMAFEPPVGIDLAEARKLLAHVDNEDYDTWLKVGMSLHHEFAGSAEALALWDGWSSTAASYASADDLAHRWESFGRSGRNPTTARWLLKVGRRDYSSMEDKTDTGNANLLARLTNGDLRRVPDRGVWLWWDGSGWLVDTHGVKAQAATALVAKHYHDEVENIAKMAAEPSRDSAERKRLEKVAEAVAKWEKQCRNRRGIDNMLAVAAKDPQLHLEASELDRDPWLLGVANGVVDLRTGQLRAAARDEYVTKRTAIAFNPAAKAPRWEQFVEEVTGAPGETAGEFQPRPQLAAYLQRALGYSLTGSVAEQKMFICIGAGSNGKNVLLDMFQHIVGEYCQTIPPALLMTSKHDDDAERPSPTAALLAGARMAICSESKDGHRLDGALVKRQTGGGQLTARRMRENTFKFEITHKLWLMTNHRPALDQLDDAMRGRLHLIPFDRRWNRPGHPERDPRLPDGDRDLMAKLKEEAEGVLAWLVRGVGSYLAESLVPPAEVTRLTREYFNDQDVFGSWLETCERCEPQVGWLASELYEQFLSYCNEEGVGNPHPSTQRAFSSELQRRGVEKRRDKQGARYGLRKTNGER